MKTVTVFHKFAPPTFLIDGEEVTQKEFRRRTRRKIKARVQPGAPLVSRAYEQPLESIAASVHPEQVADVRKDIERRELRGVSVEDNGRVHFHSRKSRRNFLREMGKQDNDGGYGDG
jgi:hypothetical protein